MCQAVEENAVSCKCYSVDTWKGDPQTGFYDDSVFAEVNAYNEQNYTFFSKLLRTTFDAARESFDDGTVESAAHRWTAYLRGGSARLRQLVSESSPRRSGPVSRYSRPPRRFSGMEAVGGADATVPPLRIHAQLGDWGFSGSREGSLTILISSKRSSRRHRPNRISYGITTNRKANYWNGSLVHRPPVGRPSRYFRTFLAATLKMPPWWSP